MPTNTVSASSALRKHWRRFILLLTAVVALLVLNVVVWLKSPRNVPFVKPAPPSPPSFIGSSDKLRETVVLPTPESPLPEGKSAVWCATLQLAWRSFQDQVVQGPVELEGARELARALNRAPAAELAPEHYYVAAGFIRDNILHRIRQELPARFPNAPLPDLSLPEDGAIAIAHLEIAIPYEYQFKDNDKSFLFQDGRGRQHAVRAFGIRPMDKEKGVDSYRGQVRVLFRHRDEFAVDLSVNTKPYQVLLARVARQPSLQAAWENVQRQVGRSKPRGLSEAAVLLVPNMHWRVEHHFRELEGKRILNPSFGSLLVDVFQVTQFKMDRRGTTVRSQSVIAWGNGHEPDLNPEHFLFDRPYLVGLRKRDGIQPFFLMWVDNAELLEPL